ncbi:MAG TPA: flagellar hook capping FlgD N-terminal domain-containing protein [Candidatus Hydrogenedentes bacterium]|nr:flagellar hook capping FlgD N-terminal domain-containing protein [Candidatus Hydrogenedentota bacterium]
MGLISEIGSDLRDLLKPIARGSDTLSPLSEAAAGTSVQKALLSAIKSGSDTQSPTSEPKKDELGKDTFLQLLVQQMQYQDPLAPTDNAQMIAQLAQFSALEQMNNLNANFETMSGNIDQLNFLSASSMIGRTVSGVGSDGSIINGEVKGVTMQGSIVYLTIGDRQLSMAGVRSIE